MQREDKGKRKPGRESGGMERKKQKAFTHTQNLRLSLLEQPTLQASSPTQKPPLTSQPFAPYYGLLKNPESTQASTIPPTKLWAYRAAQFHCKGYTWSHCLSCSTTRRPCAKTRPCSAWQHQLSPCNSDLFWPLTVRVNSKTKPPFLTYL